MPDFSIITITLNNADQLRHTLQSAAIQTGPSFEHIVIDGGSRDHTPTVLAAHAASHLQVVSEPDHGIYDAMNKGLMRARGAVVCFLNAGDIYAHPRVLSDVHQCFDKEPVDAVFGDVSFFRPRNPDKIVRHYRSSRFHPNRLAYGWMPAHPASFIRRRIYEEQGHFRTDYKVSGDFEFFARIFTRMELRYTFLPEILVRMPTGGATSSGWRNKILSNRENLRACRTYGINSNWAKLLSRYPAKLLEFLK